ncbi:hypothetical protein HMPREF1981_02943 [Bacteroides pyogenes F0041]|uniref:Uncharacterized protein n=1 Tax=Bacteroides pyogenes F0041 TaxID=1321819 RepID=U2DJT6_9BACE|nr:hypothetical protein HMPREF1981_02943 [Bacteroides pyogenes F0041]
MFYSSLIRQTNKTQPKDEQLFKTQSIFYKYPGKTIINTSIFP